MITALAILLSRIHTFTTVRKQEGVKNRMIYQASPSKQEFIVYCKSVQCVASKSQYTRGQGYPTLNVICYIMRLTLHTCINTPGQSADDLFKYRPPLNLKKCAGEYIY